jgi:hypothetical protein
MILKQVLKQARGHCRPQVRIDMCTPFPCEAPDFIRVLLDMIGYTDDRLPARVQLAIGGFLAGQNTLCLSYGVEDTRVYSQRQR